MSEGILAPYRVLDLTDEKGLYCAKILADMGADVIKVEKPGGDLCRNIGPFYHDIPHPERSLFWFALNTNKRGITLNLESTEGQAIFRRLVMTADVIVEAFQPGYLHERGIGYDALSSLKPDIILVSITPFGQTGPYKDFKGSDIVIMAMGGQMFCSGDADRPPVRVSEPQAYLHCGAHAAVGALMALQYRNHTGQGQHVDVSAQESVMQLLTYEPIMWSFERRTIGRLGQCWWTPHHPRRVIYACEDGYVSTGVYGGRGGRHVGRLVGLMEEKGMADFLREVDWDRVNLATMTDEEYYRIEGVIAAFLKTCKKAEILDQGVKRRLLVQSVNVAADIVDDEQLAARGFWEKVEHPELGETMMYPGLPFKLSATQGGFRRRAPLIGEHNLEVYGELGYTLGEIGSLREANIV